jgi:hypothetical protein
VIKKLALTGALVFVALQSADASSDKSWDRLFAKVNGTCIGESRMNTPEVSEPIVFGDTKGTIAVLLRGSLGKEEAKAKKINLMCLYDKKSGKASIVEYRWLGN